MHKRGHQVQCVEQEVRLELLAQPAQSRLAQGGLQRQHLLCALALAALPQQPVPEAGDDRVGDQVLGQLVPEQEVRAAGPVLLAGECVDREAQRVHAGDVGDREGQRAQRVHGNARRQARRAGRQRAQRNAGAVGVGAAGEVGAKVGQLFGNLRFVTLAGAEVEDAAGDRGQP
jgi:hypothetical protein